jgi:hypothetical protein
LFLKDISPPFFTPGPLQFVYAPPNKRLSLDNTILIRVLKGRSIVNSCEGSYCTRPEEVPKKMVLSGAAAIEKIFSNHLISKNLKKGVSY